MEKDLKITCKITVSWMATVLSQYIDDIMLDGHSSITMDPTDLHPRHPFCPNSVGDNSIYISHRSRALTLNISTPQLYWLPNEENFPNLHLPPLERHVLFSPCWSSPS